MDLNDEVNKLVGQTENEQLEYKAVLPPSRNIAQIISAFANNKGGMIILGIAKSQSGIIINGLSEDFQAFSVTHKAVDLLMPKPVIKYQYVNYKDKRLYAIKVEKSEFPIYIEGKIYLRDGANVVLKNPIIKESKSNGLAAVEKLNKILDSYRMISTGAKLKFIEHYQSVLNIVDDLERLLYPSSPNIPTNNQEGKILIRILFSSCADIFETFLSDLLYEIYLANPLTLKSSQQVTIKEVLDCVDLQEFVIYWSKKKLSKLQRGSVKGFILENDQINNLQIIDEIQQEDIEKILQIRHLYAHRNGVVDEKFIQFFPGQFNINDEHVLTINEMLVHFEYLLNTVDRIDKAAIEKYQLATLI